MRRRMTRLIAGILSAAASGRLPPWSPTRWVLPERHCLPPCNAPADPLCERERCVSKGPTTMATRKLPLLPGGGIGPEVMAEVKRLIDYMNRNGLGRFEVEEALVSGASYDT